MHYWHLFVPVLAVIGTVASISERVNLNVRQKCAEERFSDLKQFEVNNIQKFLNGNAGFDTRSNKNRERVYSDRDNRIDELRNRERKILNRDRSTSGIRDARSSFETNFPIEEVRQSRFENHRQIESRRASRDVKEKQTLRSDISLSSTLKSNSNRLKERKEEYISKLPSRNKLQQSRNVPYADRILGSRREERRQNNNMLSFTRMDQIKMTTRQSTTSENPRVLRIISATREDHFRNSDVIRLDKSRLLEHRIVYHKIRDSSLNPLQRQSTRRVTSRFSANVYDERIQRHHLENRQKLNQEKVEDKENIRIKQSRQSRLLRSRDEPSMSRVEKSILLNHDDTVHKNIAYYSKDDVRTDVTREILKTRLIESISTRRENLYRNELHQLNKIKRNREIVSNAKLNSHFSKISTDKVTNRYLREQRQSDRRISPPKFSKINEITNEIRYMTRVKDHEIVRKSKNQPFILHKPENQSRVQSSAVHSHILKTMMTRNYNTEKLNINQIENSRSFNRHDRNTIDANKTGRDALLRNNAKITTQFSDENQYLSQWKVFAFYGLQGIYLITLVLKMSGKSKWTTNEDKSIFRSWMDHGTKRIKVD